MEKNNITASNYLKVQVLRATENSLSYHVCGLHIKSISLFVPLSTSMAFLECPDRAQAETQLQLGNPLSSRLIMYGDRVKHTIRPLRENKCFTH